MTTTAASRAVRLAVGRGAIARPRQAVVAAGLLLVLVAAALLLLTRPWESEEPAASARVSPAQITEEVSRSAYGPGGVQVKVILATRDYLRVTRQQAAAARYAPASNHVFFLLEHKHNGDLRQPLRPVLRAGGMSHEPTRVVTTLDSSHHRFTVLVYPRMDLGLHAMHGGGALELLLPASKAGAKPTVLSWGPGGSIASAAGAGRIHLTWATLLALFGGLLSSMWPCLFQLSVYFVPTLAGVSAVEASGTRTRARVVKIAGAFVLGFVIVYTAAGAAAGFAAQSLGSTSVFWSFRRPLAITAGIVLLLAALRMAANGRAPLVCKMPIGNFLGRKRLGYLGTMVLGVAFAVGCTTCFGAAIVLAMVTYVGVAGTPLSGAMIMLVFALGMAIPLMAGAAAMAHVMSRLSRLDKIAPYMIVGASVIMAGFAVLLLTGHNMALSNLVAGG
jgi:cytochrome c-type biogenesis protein